MSEETASKEKAETKSPGLNAMDVVAIVACWAGVAAVTWFSKDPVVAVIVIAAAYYLAKWVILKREK